MVNNRMKEIFNDCLKRFDRIKDYDDRACVEDIIVNFERYTGGSNPYLYTMLYMDGQYEDFTVRGTLAVNANYKKFAVQYNDFFTKIFNNYAGLELYDEVKTDTKVPNMNDIIKEFFKTIDEDLYQLFIKSEDNIFRVYQDGDGKAFYDPTKDEIYVLLGKNLIFDNMVGLVHEMGHAYRDYLIKKRYITRDLDEHIKSEIYSETLELLFVKYLIDNDIYAIDANNYLAKYNNKIIRVSRTLSENVFVHDNGSSTLSDIKYLLGRILAYFYLDANVSLKDFFMYIDSHNLLDILNNPNINYQAISDNVNKNYCLKKQ